MVSIPLYGGPSKRDIIQLAYEECGQAGYEFEIIPEEYQSALRRLNSMLSEWLAGKCIDLGYNFPTNGTEGSPEDESGIPPGALQVVALKLAERIAPSIGKTLATETRAAMEKSWSLLLSSYSCIPSMQFGRNTVRGAGNRRFGIIGPYFRGIEE